MMIKVIGLISLMFFSSGCLAGYQSGKVAKFGVRSSDGLVWVELDGVASDKLGCARYSYWMIKDEKSLAGKLQYAQLLSARVSGQIVTIQGDGSCSRWGDGENIDTIII